MLHSFDADDDKDIDCSVFAAVFLVPLLLFSDMMKNGLRDVDVDDDDDDVGGAVADDGFAVVAGFFIVVVVVVVVMLGFLSVGEANARVLVGFVALIGATFAVMPNFETADCELLVDVVWLPNSGTVSSDCVDDADFDFCDVYDANLILSKPKKNNTAQHSIDAETEKKIQY